MRLKTAFTYDITGDIHGCARTLVALLKSLGYGEPGSLRAPDGHHLVLVGDLVDRGPDNRTVLAIVMELVEAGHASMVLGNHDLNFLAMRHEHPGKPGRFARSHSEKNLAQAATTLAETAADPSFFADAALFLLRQPVWLENDDIRVVHACPDIKAYDRLIATRHLDADGRLTQDPDKLFDLCGFSRPGDLRSLLLSGPEHQLPDGEFYYDHGGVRRTMDRTKWWNDARYRTGKVTFFGHYAEALMREDTIALFNSTTRSFCVDRGLAKGGPLVAISYTPSADDKTRLTVVPDLDMAAARSTAA